MKQFNKDHYNYGDETEVTMNNTDEMIWKDDRVLGELKYFLFNRFHYIKENDKVRYIHICKVYI